MENAGRGAAETLLSLGVVGSCLVLCGKGNNGGDGFVLARHLRIHNIPVQVAMLPEALAQLTGDAKLHAGIWQNFGPIEHLSNDSWTWLEDRLKASDWVIDALFGTGLTGPPRSPFFEIIERINRHANNVFALDIPSGLDCDTGEVMGVAVRAHHTATFVGLKQGFLNPASRAWTGRVHVVPIGIPVTERLPMLCHT
jgi:NAD(P)H-hydrate epimerase